MTLLQSTLKSSTLHIIQMTSFTKIIEIIRSLEECVYIADTNVHFTVVTFENWYNRSLFKDWFR